MSSYMDWIFGPCVGRYDTQSKWNNAEEVEYEEITDKNEENKRNLGHV